MRNRLQPWPRQMTQDPCKVHAVQRHSQRHHYPARSDPGGTGQKDPTCNHNQGEDIDRTDDSIAGFNPGVMNPIITVSPHEDFTAGETNTPHEPVCKQRWIDGTQYHMLTFLGPWWGQGEPRFTDKRLIQLTRDIVEPGGVVTWDVPHHEDGTIPAEFLAQLAKIA